MNKSCCFIGHRKVENPEKVLDFVTQVVEVLIAHENVENFLFGSRSEFNDIARQVVAALQKKYPNIKTIAYPCRHETFFVKGEEDIAKLIHVELINFFDSQKDFKTNWEAGFSSYIQRNFAMIDASDVCIFYYNKGYLPPQTTIGYLKTKHQPNSGTALAFEYAKRKHKKIVNVFYE